MWVRDEHGSSSNMMRKYQISPIFNGDEPFDWKTSGEIYFEYLWRYENLDQGELNF